MCGPEKSEKPVRRDAIELRPRKHLLAGKHTMCGPEKSEGPVRRDAIELRPTNSAGPVDRIAYDVGRRKDRMACSRTNSNAILQPELQMQPKRQFAAQTSIRCPTPVCSPNANLLAEPKHQYAAQTPICSRLPICSPNAVLHT